MSAFQHFHHKESKCLYHGDDNLLRRKMPMFLLVCNFSLYVYIQFLYVKQTVPAKDKLLESWLKCRGITQHSDLVTDVWALQHSSVLILQRRLLYYWENICISAGQWDSMEEYTCMIPRDTHDGAFYRAVLALHQDLFSLAQQVIIFLVGFPKPNLRWTRLYRCTERRAVLKQLVLTYELPGNLFSIDALDLGDWAYLVFPETHQWMYVQIVVVQCCRV